MPHPMSHLLAGPVVFLFGPLALSFDSTDLSKIRRDARDQAQNAWIHDIIAELPRLWKTIVATFPDLQTPSGDIRLQELSAAFQTGSRLDLSPLPNTLLVPIVVASHLVQFSNILTQEAADLDARIDPFTCLGSGKEALGLCTGLLSAFALASTGSRQDFERYGAVAIRLGMLIGMVVDANDEKTDGKRFKSLSVSWNSSAAKAQLDDMLLEFPDVSLSATG